MKRYWLAALLLLAAGPAWATPSVISVKGVALQDQTFVINWSSMPTTPPTIALFDDYENGTVGVRIGTGTNSKCDIGQYDGWAGTNNFQYYSSTFSTSGSQCAQADLNNGFVGGSTIGLLRALGTHTSDYFASFNCAVPAGDVFPGVGAGGGNWKINWLYYLDGPIDPTRTHTDYVFPNIESGAIAKVPGNATSQPCRYPPLGATAPFFNPHMTPGQWQHFETYMRASNCTQLVGKINLRMFFAPGNFGSPGGLAAVSTQTWGDGQGMEYVEINTFGRNSASPTYRSHPSMDDVYIATGPSAWAHAFIADGNPYNVSTKISVLTHTAWGLTSGTFTFRTSQFSSEQTFYVYLQDENGNVSSALGPYLIGDTINVPSGDVTAPVLTDVSTANVTATASTFTWTTDENATTSVDYGATSAYGSNISTDTTLTTDHSIGLSGLASNTVFHWRAISRDAAGNVGYSTDKVFTTLAAPDTSSPTITATSATVLSDSSAEITWTTNELADSQVEYGTDTSYGNLTTVDAVAVLSHSVTLFGLGTGTTYHYRVKSRDPSGNLRTDTDNTFTTPADGSVPGSTPGGGSGGSNFIRGDRENAAGLKR